MVDRVLCASLGQARRGHQYAASTSVRPLTRCMPGACSLASPPLQGAQMQDYEFISKRPSQEGEAHCHSRRGNSGVQKRWLLLTCDIPVHDIKHLACTKDNFVGLCIQYHNLVSLRRLDRVDALHDAYKARLRDVRRCRC